MTVLNNFRLKLRDKQYVPLMQGGMGVNISTAKLALELARLGGIGHISDAMSPCVMDWQFGTKLQKQKGEQFKGSKELFPKTDVKWDEEVVYTANKRFVADTMAKKRGEGGVFINVMEKLGMGAPVETLRARLKGAMDGGIDGISLSAGLHTGSLALVEDHPRFHDVLFGIIVSSARALKIFLRSSKRVNRLPDYIVVEGPLAGGHLGFGSDWKEYQLSQIVLEVLAFLREEKLDIPVIPAGGIFTAADAMNFLELGASAVQVATRFSVSSEAGLPETVKQEYLRARESDVVVNSISPTGYLMRMLKSSPAMRSNVRPMCEPLGYILDKDGKCQYHDAYAAAGVDAAGKKLPVLDKMCICYHFMNFNCYTCGHNVYRLKETARKADDGSYILPTAEEVFNDYVNVKVEEYSEPIRLAALA